MSEAARDLAMARFRLIQPYLEHKRSLHPALGRSRCQNLLSDRPKMGKPVSQACYRMTGGNFRLLTRLLTQIERVLSVNDLRGVSTAVVEAARDSLVIGPG